jgi:hypothetical protein
MHVKTNGFSPTLGTHKNAYSTNTPSTLDNRVRNTDRFHHRRSDCHKFLVLVRTADQLEPSRSAFDFLGDICQSMAF